MTSVFPAGEMTFKEFVSEINTGEDEISSENDDSEMDEDWKPPEKKTRNRLENNSVYINLVGST